MERNNSNTIPPLLPTTRHRTFDPIVWGPGGGFRASLAGRRAALASHVFGAKHSGWRPFHLPAPNKQLSPDADLRSVSSCSTARALHYNARYRLSAASVPLGPSISTATSLGWPAPSLLGRTSRGKGETLTPRPSNQISPSDLWRLLHNSKGSRPKVWCWLLQATSTTVRCGVETERRKTAASKHCIDTQHPQSIGECTVPRTRATRRASQAS